ncbi:MAG: tyrosine-protein phosphatase [Acidimicrobiales bacterium]
MTRDPAGQGQAAGKRQRRVPFVGPVNFRDIGGYRTDSGRFTRWGLVYRSDGLHRLTAADLADYERLGIQTVYDLRGDQERLEKPNPMPSVHVNVESQVPRHEFEDGSALQTAMDAENRLRDVYLATLRTGPILFGELLTALAAPEHLPAVIHCMGGKDRTGVATALLLSTLGVDRATILDDYELTNTSVTAERVDEVRAMFLSVGMGHGAATGLLRAPRWALAEALDWIDSEFGSVERYLATEGRLSSAALAALRANLLD